MKRVVHAGLIGCLFTGRLLAGDDPAPTVTKKDTTVEFFIGKELVTTYHHGPEHSKPFFWPVNAPGTVPLTRAWPIDKRIAGESNDHVHQKSLWLCHGDVIPVGLELRHKSEGVAGVDFWNENAGHGIIACVEVGKPTTDSQYVSIATRNEWRTADGQKVLDEYRVIELHSLRDARLLVLRTELNASAVTVEFGDTKEGCLGLRVSDQIAISDGKGVPRPRPGRITNADGKAGESNCWGRPSNWCDYSGTVNGKPVGISVFDDSKNPWRACWHVRNYGLLAANPFGRAKSGFPAVKGNTDLVRLEKGESLRLRYGVLLRRGDAASGKISQHFDRFQELKR